MKQHLRVLIVAGSDRDADAIVTPLHRLAYILTVERVETLATLCAAIDSHRWDITIVCSLSRHCTTTDALTCIREHARDLPIILVAGAVADEGETWESVDADVCLPADRLDYLPFAVRRTLREAEERRNWRRTEEALQRNEERYQELIENANDAIFTTDLDGNLTSVNAAAESLSGYPRDEVCGMNIRLLLDSVELDRAWAMLSSKLRGDRSATTYELDLIRRDGERIPIEVSTRLIYHANHPEGVQGIARDIRERRRAAEALQESADRYRGLFENASDIIYTHDLHGQFTSVNHAMERASGYRREHLLQRKITDILAPTCVEFVQEMMRHILYEVRTTYDLEIISQTGQLVTLEINSQLMYQGGKPSGVQAIARDITERRRAHEELVARSRKHVAIAELGQQALAISDLSILFEETTRVITQTLGVEFCMILELLPDAATLRARAGRGWREGIVEELEIGAGLQSQAGYALAASEPVIMEDLRTETRFTISPVLTSHGIVSGMSAIIHGRDHPWGVLSAFTNRRRAFTDRRRPFTEDDIYFLRAVANVLATAIERKRLEEERTRHDKELANRVLEAQEEERKRIARELHDETAQTLSMLLTHVDLLEAQLPPESATIPPLVDRISALARRSLDSIRALSHDLRPAILDDVGLVAALQWLATEYERSFGYRVHVLTRSFPATGLRPEMEVALFRIAQEALTNAGKHARADKVSVSLSCRRGAVRLVIKDNGRGFDTSHISRPTRQGRLGLYGMRERAALLGGVLNIKTTPAHGTSIEITIPIQESQVDTPAKSA